jgi:hypothetical protein
MLAREPEKGEGLGWEEWSREEDSGLAKTDIAYIRNGIMLENMVIWLRSSLLSRRLAIFRMRAFPPLRDGRSQRWASEEYGYRSEILSLDF